MRRVELIRGDAAVRHIGRAVDLEDLLLVHALQQVAEAVDDDLVADDEHAFASILAADGIDHAAQAQDDIAPALAAGRAEIEPSSVTSLCKIAARC